MRDEAFSLASVVMQQAGFAVQQSSVPGECGVVAGTVLAQDQPPGIAVAVRGGATRPVITLRVATADGC